jgi:hypothetical protein
MRDRPSGAALLALARDVLLDDLLPLLPVEAHVKARLVATCLAIAHREAEAGQGPADALSETLRAFYSGVGASAAAVSPPRERGEGGGQGTRTPEDLWRRFALDLRNGAFETSESQESAARAILWRLTIAGLRESNPGFLAANRIAGS